MVPHELLVEQEHFDEVVNKIYYAVLMLSYLSVFCFNSNTGPFTVADYISMFTIQNQHDLTSHQVGSGPESWLDWVKQSVLYE